LKKHVVGRAKEYNKVSFFLIIPLSLNQEKYVAGLSPDSSHEKRRSSSLFLAISSYCHHGF
jgi:hypothetical protein